MSLRNITLSCSPSHYYFGTPKYGSEYLTAEALISDEDIINNNYIVLIDALRWGGLEDNQVEKEYHK